MQTIHSPAHRLNKENLIEAYLEINNGEESTKKTNS